MLDTTEIAVFIALGLVFAAGLIALGRWFKIEPKRLAAYALIAIAFLYVGFAIRAEESATWVGFEMTGVAVFGSLAGMAIIGAPFWALIGFALHAGYAYYFHYTGAGQAFTPATFVVATIAFDVVMALYAGYTVFRSKSGAPLSASAPSKQAAHAPTLDARSQKRKKSA